MSIFAEHEDGLAEVIYETRQPFKWVDREWFGVVSGASLRKPMEAGGYILESDLAITCLVGQFTSALNITADVLQKQMPSTLLTYRGRGYVIDTATLSPDGRQLRIQATDANL